MTQTATERRPPDSLWSRRIASAPPSAHEAAAAETPAAFTPGWHAVARAAALFVGGIALLTAFSELRTPGPNADFGWIDLRRLSPAAARGVLALCGSLLMAWAVRPQLPPAVRRLALSAAATLFAFALWNSFSFFQMLRAGTLRSTCPVPIGLHVGACLAIVLAAHRDKPLPSAAIQRDLRVGTAAMLACLLGFPLVQMTCLGQIDRRGAADAIVLFIAQSPTGEVADTPPANPLQTAAELYQAGLAGALLVAIGSGDRESAEAAAFLHQCEELGIPADQVFIEPHPGTIQGAVSSTAGRLHEQTWRRVLTVGDGYQLPRIGLWYRRAGIEALPVPVATRSAAGIHPLADEGIALWRCLLGLPDR